MKQKPSQRLQTVLKLAQLKEQQAAEKLAASIREAELQKQQEQQFTQYKKEYDRQFETVGTEGVSAAQLANYQRFYGGLEAAGNTQQERVHLAGQQQEQARTQWQQQYSRQKNMEKLVEHKRQQEDNEAENKLQREQDDRRPVPPAE